MKKDYWDLSYKSFFCATILSVNFFISGLNAYLEPAFGYIYRTSSLKSAIFFMVAFVAFLVITFLFKKRSPKAITAGYAYLILAIVVILADYFFSTVPVDFSHRIPPELFLMLLYLFCYIYLLVMVYKASKQGITQPQPVTIKNYWNILEKGFRGLSIIALVTIPLSFVPFLLTHDVSDNFRTTSLTIAILYLVVSIISFVLASLFKKRSPKAIVLGYASIVLFSIFPSALYFILFSSDGLLTPYGVSSVVLTFVILFFGSNTVYKASKQGINQ